MGRILLPKIVWEIYQSKNNKFGKSIDLAIFIIFIILECAGRTGPSFKPLWGGLVDLQPYIVGLWPIPNSIWNLVSPCHIRGGPFFDYLWLDVCSLRYEVKHASSLHVYGRCAHAHARRGAKIVVSIHWTLLSNFPFLHHPPFLHRLKTITKYRNVHARLRALRARACTYGSQIFFGASLIPPPTSYQVS